MTEIRNKINLYFQEFGKTPSYLQRMKAEAAEEARRWEEEQEAELRRKEAMKLSQEERDNILQVSDTMVTLSLC